LVERIIDVNYIRIHKELCELMKGLRKYREKTHERCEKIKKGYESGG